MTDNPKTTIATKKLADEFRTMEPAPGDRRLSESRVEHLRNEMANGRFRSCVWASARCLADGKLYRVNGQHSSAALATFTENAPSIAVTVERFEADTLADVSDLYSTYDSRRSARSPGDIVRSFAAADPEIRELPDGMNNVVAAALGVWQSKCETRDALGPEGRARLLLDERTFVLWFAKAVGRRSKENASLFRSGVIAAMRATLEKDAEQSDRFWRAVLTGSDADPQAPTRVLGKFLLTAKVGSGKSSTRELYSKSLTAWNAFRRGVDKIEVLTWNKSRLPEAA
jgi:hypothetical protein